MKAYGVSRPGGPLQASDIQAAADRVNLYGTAKKPSAPRDLKYLPSARAALISWALPENASDIRKWRIYKDTENNLYTELSDPSVTQVSIELSSGTTPPVTNIFVSAINAAGKESMLQQIQVAATAETGAPSVPTPPAEWSDPTNPCVEVGTWVEVPDGTTEEILPNADWIGLQFRDEEPLYMTPETMVSVFVRAKDLECRWYKPWTWFRPTLHIETGKDGSFTPKFKTWSEQRQSFLVKRICPGGTYRAGKCRTRVHNAKAPYYG